MQARVATDRSSRLALLSAAFLAGTAFLAGIATSASAQEACVRCDNPFAIYRCQVDLPGLPANASITLICITELAKRHGHATCAVSRDTGSVCNGEVALVAPSPNTPIPQAPPPGIVAASPAIEPAQPGPAANPDEMPRTATGEDPASVPPKDDTTPETVEELAKQTAKASQKGLQQAGGAVVDAAKKTGQTIEKTGDAIGSAAKKTWRCISSLFGNC